MKVIIGAVAATVLVAGSAANAEFHKTLQLDINQIGVQSRDTAGHNSPFGGLTHSGSLNFSFSSGLTHLLGVFIREGQHGPSVNQGFTGTLTDVDGVIHMSGGQIMGGNMSVTVDGTDTFSTQVSSGSVIPFAGGGYRIQGLTFDGTFSGPMFSNVDVSTWFEMQPLLGGHPGSFLSFNFQPDPSGAAHADMDIFVEVIPLPPAAWMGLAMMSGIAAFGYVRRRR